MAIMSNAAVAQRVNDMVSRWDLREDEYRAWASGTATGGPYGDGRYPLSLSSGEVFYVKCPAALQAQVDGPAGTVALMADAATADAAAAETSAITAGNASAQAMLMRDQALAHRDSAELAKGNAQASAAAAANARTAAETAAASASADAATATQAATEADTDRIAAEAARDAAEASAAAAATFDPELFYTKTVSDLRYPVLSNDQLPSSYLPPVAITETYEAVSEAEMLSLPADQGDVCVRTDLNRSFILRSSPAYEVTNWVELRTPTDTVLSVAGKTGAVALTSTDIGGLGTLATQDNLPWTSVTGGDIPDDRLPARLRANGRTISDWNTATESGWYQGNNAANGPPGTGWVLGRVISKNYLWVEQIAHFMQQDGPNDSATYRRDNSYGSGWSAWVRVRMTEPELSALFAPLAHTHGVSDVTGLQAALDAKAGATHAHSLDDITTGDTLTVRAGSSHALMYLRDNVGAARGLLLWQATSDYVSLRHYVGGNIAGDLTIDGATVTFNGNAMWHAGNFDPATKAAAAHTHVVAEITGLPTISTVDSGNTLVQRNTAGDVYARLFRSTYINTNALDAGAGLAFRNNQDTDNFVRFCNSPSVIRDWLGTDAVYLPKAGGILDGGLSFDDLVASGPTDLSKHVTLHYGGYGFGITAYNLNYVVPSTAYHSFYSGADLHHQFSKTGDYMRKNANSATLTRQPRTFVQPGDPGAAAADNDLWVW